MRSLVTWRLDPARMQLISGFIDTYLKLNTAEEELFRNNINQIAPEEQEVVMQMVTSWMEQGIEQGRQEEALALILRQLPR